MSKTQPHKPKKQPMASSKNTTMLERLYEAGNFWVLRKEAKKILASTSASAAEHESARSWLYVMQPDLVAMLVGLGCTAFSVMVAIWARY